jgi:hypothetical protein
MPVKYTIEIGRFSFPKDCCFFPDVEIDRLSPVRTPLSLFWRKKNHLYYVLFSESGSLFVGVTRA